jgi:catechol 2,3-dioxygenase-like lactoylglutathione lyase family enzyme
MEYTISGIQQLGVGVTDVEAAWKWYRSAFGLNVPVFQDEAEAPLMTRYTANAVHKRNAVLALNLSGGAGFEIWQFTSRTPQPPEAVPGLGDTGVFAGVLKSKDVHAAHEELKRAGARIVSPPTPGPDGEDRLYVYDPHGNLFCVMQAADWFGKPAAVAGVAGAVIGSSDIERALPLYQGILGYDAVIYDVTGSHPDVAGLPNGQEPVRRVLLTHSRPRRGPFSQLMGTSTIELVQLQSGTGRRIFRDRCWGDLGFIHLCFDVQGMDALAAACATIGHAFTVDSANTFDMGSAGGRFSYVEDPDGTLIEFVETHKVPIMKSLGIGLDLTKRDPRKPLPRWMIKLLGLGRVK